LQPFWVLLPEWFAIDLLIGINLGCNPCAFVLRVARVRGIAHDHQDFAVFDSLRRFHFGADGWQQEIRLRLNRL
jgi:hypothetical protein